MAARTIRIFEQRNNRCVFSEAQRQPQHTCQAETVIGNDLTPFVVL